jgi:deazaflavin-dependent oxidoreductase (nitroreductase family)
MVDLTTRPAPTAFSERIGLLCVRYMESINVSLFRVSHGRIGSSIWGTPVILLRASGRSTGRRHTKPLLGLRDDANNAWIVAASRGGTSEDPDWLKNLLAYETRGDDGILEQPTIEVRTEVGTEVQPVRTAVLGGDDRDQWWTELTAIYARFDAYQARTDRVIQVVRLTVTPSH